MHEPTHANGPTEPCDWDQVDWTKANRVVRNLSSTFAILNSHLRCHFDKRSDSSLSWLVK